MQIVRAGQVAYGEMLDLQLKLVKKRQADEMEDTLILCEHPPVITLGKNAKREHILFSDELLQSKGIEIFPITRGGDVTFHGPGQLVGYPIVHLKSWNHSIRIFVDRVEESIIQFLGQNYHLHAQRISGLTGVWVEDSKITAIGFAVQKWVTYHGFAFNINTDLSYFNYITPCGIQDKGVTSLEQVAGMKIPMEELIPAFCNTLTSTLPCNPHFIDLEEAKRQAM